MLAQVPVEVGPLDYQQLDHGPQQSVTRLYNIKQTKNS
jgi:hypothetical protein